MASLSTPSWNRIAEWLQQALFPEGVSFAGEEFGTAVTSWAFKHFEALRPTGNDLASPTGFEPVSQP